MAIAFYVRTPDGEFLDSPDAATQLDEIKELAARLGFDLTDARVFHDSGSTVSPERPGLEELEQGVSDGNVDAVFVSSADRLSRDVNTLLAFLRRCEIAGVPVHFIEGSADMARALDWIISPWTQH